MWSYFILRFYLDRDSTTGFLCYNFGLEYFEIDLTCANFIKHQEINKEISCEYPAIDESPTPKNLNTAPKKFRFVTCYRLSQNPSYFVSRFRRYIVSTWPVGISLIELTRRDLSWSLTWRSCGSSVVSSRWPLVWLQYVALFTEISEKWGDYQGERLWLYSPLSPSGYL